MKTLILVLSTIIFSISIQASIPDKHPGLIYEENILEKGLYQNITF